MTVEIRGSLLADVTGHVAPALNDLGHFVQVTKVKRDSYGNSGDGSVSTEEMFFWFKCLAGSFAVFADALGAALRKGIHDYAERLGLAMSSTERKRLVRRNMTTKTSLSIALGSFPPLFDIKPIALPDDLSEDGQALALLLECRKSIAHPTSMKDLFPPALLAVTLPAAEWALGEWTGLFSNCLSQVGGRLAGPHRPRTFHFDPVQVTAFEKRLATFYDLDQKPMFMKMIRALNEDSRRARALLVPQQAAIVPKDRQCAIRNLARVLFSDIEGTTFIVAEYLADRCGGSAPDRLFLKGMDDDVRTTIADTLDRFSAYVGKDVQVTRQGDQWGSFCRSRRLRDRVTHPRPPETFEVGEADCQALIQTLFWWHHEAVDCFFLDPDKFARIESSRKEYC